MATKRRTGTTKKVKTLKAKSVSASQAKKIQGGTKRTWDWIK